MDGDDLQVWIGIAVSAIAVASSIGVIPLVRWAANNWWERSKWVRFEKSIVSWAKEEACEPSDLTADEWKSLCAIKLSDAKYLPNEIQQCLDVAAIVARGRTSMVQSGHVTETSEGTDQEEGFPGKPK